MRRNHKPKKERAPLLKLNLGAGENRLDGFLSVDLYAKADIKLDLTAFPWPWKNESVEEVYCSHFFEHIDGPTRILFMDELYRVLIVGGKATIITPYWSSPRAIQDPTHKWPPISEESYLYFNRDWRVANKLTHYLGHCDFDFNYGYLLAPDTAQRHQEVQQFFIHHYVRSVQDLQVNLVKRKIDAQMTIEQKKGPPGAES